MIGCSLSYEVPRAIEFSLCHLLPLQSGLTDLSIKIYTDVLRQDFAS